MYELFKNAMYSIVKRFAFFLSDRVFIGRGGLKERIKTYLSSIDTLGMADIFRWRVTDDIREETHRAITRLLHTRALKLPNIRLDDGLLCSYQ